MLRPLANARLANQHSPLSEQRLVYLRKQAPAISEGGADPDANKGLIELSKAPELAARKIGRDTRRHLAFLNDAAGIDINTLTDEEAEALTVKHVDVMQGGPEAQPTLLDQQQTPDGLRVDFRTAVTRVLSASDANEGRVLDMSRETQKMLTDMERVDWKQDAAIASFYDTHTALIRKILNLPKTGDANKTDLVLRLRYLPEVDVIMEQRKQAADQQLSKQRESQLDNQAASRLIEDLATVNWQDDVELGTLLIRHEATIEGLIAPHTFKECTATVTYQRLDWALNQLPELKGRMEQARAEKARTEFLTLSTQEVDVRALTDDLAGIKLEDAAALHDVYTRHLDTLRKIFNKNKTPIPTWYNEADVVQNAIQIVPGMQEAIDSARTERLKTGEYDVPGCQYLPEEDYREVYSRSLDADTSRSNEEKGPMLENMPSAFQFEGKIYFNLDHPESRDPVKGPRSVAHELTHVAIRKEVRKDKEFFARAKADLEAAGKWDELQAAVRDAFGARGNTMPDDEILEEAMAIYIGGEKHPYARESTDRTEVASWAIHQILAGIRLPSEGAPSELASKLTSVATDVDKHYEVISTKLSDAANHNVAGNELLDEFEKEKLRTNVVVQQEVREGIQKQVAAEEAAYKTPADLLAAIRKSQDTLSSFQKNKDRIREASRRMGSAQQSADATSFASIEQFASDQTTDLAAAAIYADALERWDLPEKAGGLTTAEKAHFMKEWNFGPDEKYNREEAFKRVSTYVAGLKTATKIIEDFVGRERPTEPMNVEGGLWKTLREHVFGNGKSVEWVSWSDLVKIVGIYKSAILAKWEEGKERKAHRIADNLAQGSLIAKPIEHTLKKQARAANEKQTHEFTEYLKTAGLNYDSLFGSGGLYGKLTNVNEKKAVLEFAAGKAWLFDLNKLDGHNVYGLDYIAEFGPEQFEELVQSHEGGKSKMEKEGVEKIDKDADVPRMMEVMVHELRHKNIFVVQGIMKRLQDKAKYSHSNTWMLTTLLMLIRDEFERDPALKKCLDKGMIDNISNHTIGQCAWSITWLKSKRHEIEAWKQGKANFGNNIATKTMERIEDRLTEAGVHFKHINDPGPDGQAERLSKYEMISMVLSGKTLHAGDEGMKERGLLRFGWTPGKSISIFDSEFNEYRQEFFNVTSTTPTEPNKTDPDYFNPDNGGSDVMLLSSLEYARILEHQSQGPWIHQNKATNFFQQLLIRDAELAKVNPSLQRNFRKHVHARLIQYVNNVVAQAAANKNILTVRTRESSEDPPELRGVNLLDQLYVSEFIDESQLKRLTKDLGDKPADGSPPGTKSNAAIRIEDIKKKKAEAEAKTATRRAA